MRLRAQKDPEYSSFLAEPNYYEDLAVLCRHKALDKRIVSDSFGTLVSERYDAWKLVIEEFRKTDLKNYEHFEHLAREMREPPSTIAKLRIWFVEKSGPSRLSDRWASSASSAPLCSEYRMSVDRSCNSAVGQLGLSTVWGATAT